jgi:hypothetical protein
MIVPFAPGGGTDVAARIVGEHMARTLGQQIVIQNIVGAGGTTGSTRAMRADPDGYTVLMGQMGTHAISVALYPNLAYRPETDFEPIGMVSEVPQMLVARKDFAPMDLREFVAFVKANSDRINVGHAGVGSSGGPHRFTLNAQATSATRLRVNESATGSRVVFSRKISSPATFDFCNKICQFQTLCLPIALCQRLGDLAGALDEEPGGGTQRAVS